MHPLLTQTIAYAVVFMIGIFLLALLLRGFMLPYLKVRASLGRLVMVKVRSINRDYFSVGHITEKFLIFKDPNEKKDKKIRIQSGDMFYKCLAVNWVDVDESKNCVISPVINEEVDGFDAIAFQDLYKRALMRPSVNDGRDKKLMFLLLIGVGVIALVGAYYGYKNSTAMLQIAQSIKGITSSVVSPVI